MTVGVGVALAALCIDAFISVQAIRTIKAVISKTSDPEEIRIVVAQATKRLDRGQNVSLVGLFVALPFAVIGFKKQRREEKERLGKL